ncbi:hypothetical protein [Trujillonella humicola]|uniref:hypothetical protein n=1 Tax=Trujillonella humicola TaxID=3383699 RepID=UPI0039064267
MIDLIRAGVPPSELAEGGGRAVYRALVQTAASALQRGHDFAEWAALVTETRSTLGRQLRVKRGKERPQRAVEQDLRGAWNAAESWLAKAPAAYTRDDALAHVAAVQEWVVDAASPLDSNERAVMAAACRIAERIGTTRPALPRRMLMEETRLGERTVRTTLDRLNQRQLLVLEVPGKPGGDASRRRAHLYRLPDATALESSYLYRGTRSVGPPVQIYGTPGEAVPGTPGQVYGTPGQSTFQAEAAMVTVTISATDPDALAATIEAIRRSNPAVSIQPDQRGAPLLSVVDGEGQGASTRQRSA